VFHSSDWPQIWLVLQRMAITYALTVLIGWDREKETHGAGVRTFPIVGMASCGYLLILGSHPDSGDQSRLLQGLITGIGFVGGGAILRDGDTVKGTATAASIWNAGVIGAAVATGRYEVAIILALLNLLTLRALLPLKLWLDRKSKIE
jgi:putative Mg2+ transporter-C (MgtC) family protein